jgi:enoyl-CoA hydratase
VQGWCIAGGTDMVLNADLIVAGESARFGYPPARVWGVPEAPWVWVARLGLARRIALLPLNQLQMMKWMLNDVARHQYEPETSRLLGFIFDGVARHTQEGLDFVARSVDVGFRQAVRERDDPFGDYGSRPRT